jgi:endonuclease/exonuclease/phosphatase family metal-dependent hydrolase
MRVPAYSRFAERRAYWEGLEKLVAPARDRRIVFIGDFNADPETPRYVGCGYLRRLAESGWFIPRPEGDWSCETRARRHSRIDHALVSPLLGPASTRYSVGINGDRIVGNGHGAVSDHAALVVDLPME